MYPGTSPTCKFERLEFQGVLTVAAASAACKQGKRADGATPQEQYKMIHRDNSSFGMGTRVCGLAFRLLPVASRTHTHTQVPPRRNSLSLPRCVSLSLSIGRRNELLPRARSAERHQATLPFSPVLFVSVGRCVMWGAVSGDVRIRDGGAPGKSRGVPTGGCDFLKFQTNFTAPD